MRFALVDRIVELTPGEQLRAIKAVSASEEYLADHFPTFAVLPGVFMLEAMVEAAAWLVRATQDFAPSLVLLREAKNITYKSFVRPGDVLDVTVRCRRLTRDESEFSGVGVCQQREVVKGRFSLMHGRLSDRHPMLARIDEDLIRGLRARYAALRDLTEGVGPRAARETKA
ncbi:MAG: beta-hydroxyacyl-ACP dehydratase [Phycisphaerales bacterium]|nr:beta-hydroxyacyl-ACP dehydratase [Phycisphaerales bacterium]